MEFDIRRYDYVFKHAYAPKPELNAERYKEHFHPTCEFLYFMRGDADYMCQHTLYHGIEGCLLVAKPGEYHNVVFHSDAPYERYVIRFNPFALFPYLRQQLETAKSVYHIEGTVIADLFAQLDQHLSAVHKDVRLAICLGFLQILIAYLISSESMIQKADYVNLDAKRILDYVDANLRDIHTADELVDALHMSKSAIYKVFSSQFNTPLMAYIRTQKCIQARQLLAAGMTATEAAEHLGFSHYSSFYRDYIRVFHESPAAAKEAYQMTPLPG